jgi:hypothetical protein
VHSIVIAHSKNPIALTAQFAPMKFHASVNIDVHLSPRYEVRTHWESGRKRFAVHDLQQEGRLVEEFDTIRDASVQCALLWLEHVRAVRRNSTLLPLTSFPSQEPTKAP